MFTVAGALCWLCMSLCELFDTLLLWLEVMESLN
jgi:hypothetical protein